MERIDQRESWGTRGGFVLAAIGSAVGLGNLWSFPYKIYSHGGGAFLIPYIIAMFVVGIPMLIMEFSLGHMTQKSAPDAYRKTNRKIEFVGWWGIILAFVIITYYPVILAYCFTYLGHSIRGIFNGGILPWAGTGVEGVENANKFFFDKYLHYTEGFKIGNIQMHLFWPLLITWIVMYLCIFKGVKLVGKIVWLTVPLPWIMLLILTVRGLTLEGSMQGLAYYLDPTWSELLKPETWTFAFGQAFFSLSLAFGVMLTYASFLHRKSDINNNAAIIGISDFATSFIAGLAVFATIGGMAFATQQTNNPIPVEQVIKGGPGLAFVAFPYALAQLPYSAWFSFVFFFALVTLGVDSAFSITESVLSSIVDKTGWKRCIVLPVMSTIGLATGLIFITEGGGLNWLGHIDSYINGTWGIAFMGLLQCVTIGWLGNIEKLRLHANSRSDWKLGKSWSILIKIIIPTILATLFFWNLFNEMVLDDGFFFDSIGNAVLPNIIGTAIFIIILPAIAIMLSLLKSNNQSDEKIESVQKEISIAPLAVSIVFTIFNCYILYTLKTQAISSALQITMAVAAIIGLASVIVSNRILNKLSGLLCWRAGFAGIIGTLGLGAFLANQLINYTLYKNHAQQEAQAITHQLSATSYIILAFVFLIITFGLGWCLYKAMAAANGKDEPQKPNQL